MDDIISKNNTVYKCIEDTYYELVGARHMGIIDKGKEVIVYHTDKDYVYALLDIELILSSYSTCRLNIGLGMYEEVESRGSYNTLQKIKLDLYQFAKSFTK